jgi:hypothetical protein
VQTLGGQAPQALRQNLAVAQANRLHKNAEREIDAANRAAEQRDWDTAVAGLRSAIQILGGQAPQALRQNLAVVLANRANKNAEPAMKAFAAARDAAQPDIRAALAIVQRHYRRSPRRVFRWAGAAVSAAIPAGGWILWLTMLSANGWVGAVTWIATIGFFLYIGVSLLRDRGKRAPQRYDSAAPVHCGMCQEPGTYQAELASGAGSPIVLCATHAQMLEGQAGVTIREHTPTRIAAVCCKVCGKAASHEARRGAVEKVSLCASHVRALQRAATSITWRPDPDLARRLGVMLAGPEADLNEAAALAPRLGGVRESLQQLRDLRSRMGLPARR